MPKVVIIGGGPGGAATGCFLSKAGISNIIFEAAIHPRPHVGESLVTSTTRQFEALGFLETMEREGFVRKYGASWHPPKKRANISIEFKEFPQEGVNQDYTWHVDRSRFDSLLLKHAEQLGSEVYQGVRVREVRFEDGYAKGVRVEFAGQSVDVECDVVVDASGRSAVVGRHLGWKEVDPQFNQFAVHNWFEDVDRGERPDDIHVHFLPIRRGWVWQIPITDTVTSMGVVTEKEVFKQSDRDYEGWFHSMIETAPDIAAAMRDARPVNEFKVEGDYSYSMTNFVGDGFLLVGDAARFVDPIFSSGVSIAMASAEFAAARIEHCLDIGDVSAEALRPYEERLRSGTAVWYEFITLYYKLMPLFTYFIHSEKYRHQVLELLQGQVYDREEAPVLDAMREYVAAVETSTGHLLHEALDPSILLDTAPLPTEP